VTKHREYFDLTPERLCATMRKPVVVDGRRVFDAEEARLAGFVYRVVEQ
jgi:hypothetical protein